ncbi:MAG: GNAT family N-acetyltransferase [Myxococcota bacterium]
MSDRFKVREVAADRVQQLRTEVLRDWEYGRLCVFDEDEHEDTHHFAVVDQDDRVRGVVTYIRRRCPELDERPGYQLRGMAIAEDDQRYGLGSRLIQVSVPRLALAEPDAKILWCNAREHVIPFYERLGFEGIGDLFEIEGIGPHLRMWREMPVVMAG